MHIAPRSRQATGSTPMATRWSSSEGPIVALGMTVLLMACVSTVTRYYLPDAKNPRFDTEQAARMLDQYVRVQCPERLAAKKPESGAASLTILTDTGGAVTRAELASTSGDEVLDGVFGTIAAQL